MNIKSTGIAVAFLFGTAAVVYGQQDSTAAKNEKRIEGVQIRAAAKRIRRTASSMCRNAL